MIKFLITTIFSMALIFGGSNIVFSEDFHDSGVFRVTVANRTFTDYNSNNLSFGTLTYDTDNNIFVSPFYYSIQIGSLTSQFPNINIQYEDTGFPTGASTRFGNHGVFTYSRVTQNSGGGDTETNIDGMSFAEVNGLTISASQFNTGYLRINIGIATGNPNADEGSAIPFTTSVQAGNYMGSLIITSTAP